jgi:LmbE family N-acetylglucosaminyl deacetylase
VLDILYLSPHLDDAVLSGGGHLAQSVRKGLGVKVLTVFSGDPVPGVDSPVVRELRADACADAGMSATRRAEDAESCRRLGVAYEHWGFTEAVYRLGAEGEPRYPTRKSLFLAPSGDDVPHALIERLAAAEKAGLVVAPLAAGGHVDHRLVRLAAERVFGAALVCYEDFPYGQRFGAVWRALGNPFAWCAERVELEEADLMAKIEAVRAHASQTASLFHGDADLVGKIRRYARRRGGERLWRRRV